MASVIIIGGGPAGSVAGLLLARAGFTVDLFEQHSFPRDKVCGECLSGLGIGVLRRAGILSALEIEKPVWLKRSLLHPIYGPSIEVPLPRPSMGISRMKMDVILLHAARQAGVKVHQPARCESIDTACTPRLKWRDLQLNSRHEISADWIIVADGKGSFPGKPVKATGDLGIKTHFANINGPRDAIELFAGRGNYGGLAAVEDNKWNAAFSVPVSLVRESAGDLQRVFNRMVAANPILFERVADAHRVGPWLASPLPRFAIAKEWQPQVIPVGNAAAALEPVGGEGMGLALRSAELAADAIIKAEETGEHQAIHHLRHEFKKLWQIRRTVCRGIAMMFSTESLSDAAAPLMAANVNISTAVMRLAGK